VQNCNSWLHILANSAAPTAHKSIIGSPAQKSRVKYEALFGSVNSHESEILIHKTEPYITTKSQNMARCTTKLVIHKRDVMYKTAPDWIVAVCKMFVLNSLAGWQLA
jgi:hypothetical protein